jgi:hypothetical protein
MRSILRQAPPWGILWGGSASIAVLFGIFRLMLVSEPEDRSRLNILTAMPPKRTAGEVSKVLPLPTRPALRGAAEARRYR